VVVLGRSRLLLLLAATGVLGAWAASSAAAEGAEGEPRPSAEGVLPAGLEVARTLDAGEWQLSYDYSHERFDGNRDSRHHRSVSEVRSAGFSEVPVELVRETHRVTLAFAPVERVTLRAQLPVLRLAMEELAPDGSVVHLRESGVGDLTISGIVPFIRHEGEQLQLGLGLSLPTGSISGHDVTPEGRERLPYPLRLGSGTVDLVPTVAYLGRAGDAAWGLQWHGVFRLYENRQHYGLGDRWELTSWFAWSWARWVSTSFGFTWSEWESVDGRDPALDLDSPAADPERQGGSRLDLSPGLHLRVPALPGHELLLEASVPVYQKLDGPQLERDWRLSAGWRWTFAGFAP
jgi:hypothetical protein